MRTYTQAALFGLEPTIIRLSTLFPPEYTPFKSESARIAFLRPFKFPKKALKTNRFLYKGYYLELLSKPEIVSIVGQTHVDTVIIQFSTGELHAISGYYLKQMQSAKFLLESILNHEEHKTN